MISASTIQAIRDLPLEQAIGQYVKLKKKPGGTWLGSSPFNDEKTPSFNVQSNKGIWKDFSSGKGGRDVISFLMAKEGLEFKDAVIQAANDNGIAIEYDKDNAAYHEEQEKRKTLTAVYEWALAEFQKHPLPAAFLQRFPEAALNPFRVGYCPPEGVISEARKAGYSLDELEKSGLFMRSRLDNGEWTTIDKFTDRVMLPQFDYRGSIIGFSGRQNPASSIQHRDAPKYMHTSGLDKSAHLYGLHLAKDAIHKAELAYLVEGPTDVIRFHLHKISATVGQQGSDFSEAQAALLKRYCSTVCIVPDNDQDKDKNAGIEAMERNARIAMRSGLNVRVLIPGDSKFKIQNSKS